MRHRIQTSSKRTASSISPSIKGDFASSDVPQKRNRANKSKNVTFENLGTGASGGSKQEPVVVVTNAMEGEKYPKVDLDAEFENFGMENFEIYWKNKKIYSSSDESCLIWECPPDRIGDKKAFDEFANEAIKHKNFEDNGFVLIKLNEKIVAVVGEKISQKIDSEENDSVTKDVKLITWRKGEQLGDLSMCWPTSGANVYHDISIRKHAKQQEDVWNGVESEAPSGIRGITTAQIIAGKRLPKLTKPQQKKAKKIKDFYHNSSVFKSKNFDATRRDGESKDDLMHRVSLDGFDIIRDCNEGVSFNYGYTSAARESEKLVEGEERLLGVHMSEIENKLKLFCTADGISTPFYYYGYVLNYFTCHVEDLGLNSINMVMWGKPKVWLILSEKYFRVFLEKLHDYLQTLTDSKRKRSRQAKQVLKLCATLHKNPLAHPKLLYLFNIPFDVVYQEAGTIILIKPYSWHSGFNTGYNVAIASNMAYDDYFKHISKRDHADKLCCDCDEDSLGKNAVVNYSEEQYALLTKMYNLDYFELVVPFQNDYAVRMMWRRLHEKEKELAIRLAEKESSDPGSQLEMASIYIDTGGSTMRLKTDEPSLQHKSISHESPNEEQMELDSPVAAIAAYSKIEKENDSSETTDLLQDAIMLAGLGTVRNELVCITSPLCGNGATESQIHVATGDDTRGQDRGINLASSSASLCSDNPPVVYTIVSDILQSDIESEPSQFQNSLEDFKLLCNTQYEPARPTPSKDALLPIVAGNTSSAILSSEDTRKFNVRGDSILEEQDISTANENESANATTPPAEPVPPTYSEPRIDGSAAKSSKKRIRLFQPQNTPRRMNPGPHSALHEEPILTENPKSGKKELRWECECKSTFLTRSTLMNHVRDSKIEKGRFQCHMPPCDNKNFARSASLTSHLKDSHNFTNYQLVGYFKQYVNNMS